MVPRIIHQVWVGPAPFPDEFAAYTETWRRHHPEWEVRLWTEDDLPRDLRRPEALDRLRTPAERSDIFRLEVLWRHGGVYVDTDFECRKPLDDLIEGLDFFTAELKPGRVNNAFLGAVPGHPILDRALDEMQPREFHGYDKEAAGPLFVDRLLKDYPEVKRFEPTLFYPNTPEEREQAYAVHHMARSWKDAKGFKEAALRAEQRLEAARRDLAKERKKRERADEHVRSLEAQLAAARAGHGRLRQFLAGRRSTT